MNAEDADDGLDFETVLMQLIVAAEPMTLLDGSLVVSRFLLQKFGTFQDAMFAANEERRGNGGGDGLDTGILFGGLVLTLINVVMDNDGWPAAKRVALSMDLPTHSRDGVRSRIVRLLDALGLKDDAHKFN